MPDEIDPERLTVQIAVLGDDERHITVTPAREAQRRYTVAARRHPTAPVAK